jgi:pimeloyl-ACP methyl ester carboxylesterase
MSRALALALVASAASAAGGCLNEVSFPAEADRLRLFPEPGALFPGGRPPPAREWLETVHARTADLLPEADRGVLTTAALPDDPAEVFRRFAVNPAKLGSILGNFGGLMHTAQVAKGDTEGDKVFGPEPRAWPGFDSVWVPVEWTDGRRPDPVAPGPRPPDGSRRRNVRLFGRLGVHRDAAGRPVPADAVVIAVGFLGNLHGYRYRDLSTALFERGYHVLCVEVRGHGQTGKVEPDVPMTFGLLEASDLIRCSAWLREECAARRVGLIGFSWGALEALLAAWLDGVRVRPPGAETDPVWRRVPQPTDRPAFDAGVISMSPILDLRLMADSFEIHHNLLSDPVRAYVQQALMEYQRVRGAGDVDHRVWSFVRFEAGRSVLAGEYGGVAPLERAGLDFLTLRGATGAAKMDAARVPVLIVHGGNDPLSPADLIAELGRRTANPNVATLLLPGSGHGGLPAVSAPYYYSLVLNFLSPVSGPSAVAPRR